MVIQGITEMQISLILPMEGLRLMMGRIEVEIGIEIEFEIGF
jgi:hypothetical protein